MVRQIVLIAGLLMAVSSLALAQDATPTLPMEGEVPADGVVPEQQFPVEGETIDGATLGDVTANSPAYYGQQVTLEGVLEEYVNPRTFVLGEGTMLFNSKVLVINNTPIEFDPALVTGERVRITGVVMPSYNEGGFEQVIANFRGLLMPSDSTPADTTVEAVPADGAGVMEETPAHTMTDATPVDPSSADTAAIPGGDALVPTEAADGVIVIDATPIDTGATPMVATPGGVVDSSVQSPAISPNTTNFTPLTNAIAERFPDYTIVEIISVDSVWFIPPAE